MSSIGTVDDAKNATVRSTADTVLALLIRLRKGVTRCSELSRNVHALIREMPPFTASMVELASLFGLKPEAMWRPSEGESLGHEKTDRKFVINSATLSYHFLYVGGRREYWDLDQRAQGLGENCQNLNNAIWEYRKSQEDLAQLKHQAAAVIADAGKLRYSVAQVAEILDIPQSMVIQCIDNGLIRAVTFRGELCIHARWLLEVIGRVPSRKVKTPSSPHR